MTADVFMLNFLYSLLATVVGGVILAIIFFWSKERIFPLPRLEGQWYYEIITTKTAYNPYKGMILRYVAMLWQQGDRIYGTVEKIHENSSVRKHSYVGKERTRGTVNGFVQKNYFSKDHVVLHMVEDGDGRESTYYFYLAVNKDKALNGEFRSMVADQSGDARWQRSEF